VVTGTGVSSVPAGLTNATLRSFLSVTPTAILNGTQTTNTLTWNFNSGSESFNFLANGETLILTYTVSATDDDGTPLSDTETVTITITGTGDAPVITGGPDTSSLTETNAGLADSGTLTVTDLDLTDNVTAAVDSVVVTGTGASSVPGSLTNATLRSFLTVTPTAILNGTQITNTLTWNFNSGSEAFNFLATGETLILTYTVSATDDDGTPLSDTETVTITITGTGDAPVITGGPDTSSLIETNAGLTDSGTFTVTDLDLTDNVTAAVDSVVVTGTGASSVPGSLTNATLRSFLTVTPTAILNGTQTTNTLTWNFNSGSEAFDFLAAGETLVLTYTVSATDDDGTPLSDTETITITIQGQNDTPIAVADNGMAVEAGGLANGTAGSNAVGNVLTNDTDVDSVAGGETKTVSGVAAGVQSSASGNVASSVTGAYGSITVNADGTYSYSVDNANSAVQALRTNGQTLQDIFTYTVSDAGGLTSTTQVTITIQGQNDTPVGVNDTAHATEAGGVANGTAGVNPSGNVLTNDTDVDSVANGETKTVTLVVSDALGGSATAAGTAVTGSYGTITINSNGSYTYLVDNNNNAVQALRLYSDTLSESFTYTFTDTAGALSTARITITIHGADDTAVPADDQGTALEAGGASNNSPGSNATGNVLSNDTDVDAGDTHTIVGIAAGTQLSAIGSVAASVTGTYGSMIISNDGTYTYFVDNANSAVQALRLSSQTLSEVFTYTQQGSGGLQTTAYLTITIGGQNDNPLAIADYAQATEAGGFNNGVSGTNPSGNVLANDIDVDSVANGESKTVSGVVAGTSLFATGSVGVSVMGQYGFITINSNGSYSYNIDNGNTAVEALRTYSDTLNDVFTYTYQDASGVTSTSQITVTIHGANDTPHNLTSSSLVIEENLADGSLVGTTTIYDIDGGDSFTYSLVDDSLGRFAIDVNTGEIRVANSGLLNYENTTSHDVTVRVMDAAGAMIQRVFTVALTDVDEFDVTAPIDTQLTINAVHENLAAGTEVGIAAFASDFDATTNAVTYSLTDNAGNRFSIDTITGIVSTTAILDFEARSSWGITVQALSQDGSTATSNFTIAVLNVFERPIGINDSYSTSYIDDLIITGLGVLANDIDPDGDPLTAILISGPSSGTLQAFDGQGGLRYTPVAGFEGTIEIVYQSTDGMFLSDAVTISILVSRPTTVPSPTNDTSPVTEQPSTPTQVTISPPVTQPVSTVVGEQPSADTSVISGDESHNTVQSLVPNIGQSTSFQPETQSRGMKYESIRYSSNRPEHFVIDTHRESDHVNTLSGDGDGRQTGDQNKETSSITLDSTIVKTMLGSGVILLLVQGAQLAATLIAASPAWIQFDPLAVMPTLNDRDKKQSLTKGEQLFDK
jgi:VCBS repeat-containing protein